MKCIEIFLFSFVIICNYGCQPRHKNNSVKLKVIEKKESTIKNRLIKDKSIHLNDKNAIPFFYDYAKKNKENKVKILTKYGNIEIELFKKTPYHRANFIFLIKEKYFDNTLFHRVVKDFIIQGGNSDNPKISSKRRRIGKYLLPPDTKKGFKHKSFSL